PPAETADTPKYPSGKVTKEAATFKATAAEPGEVRKQTSNMNLDMKLEINMGGNVQKVDQAMEQGFERTVTITGAEADGSVTGLKVSFSKFTSKQSMGGMNDRSKDLVGKTFVLELEEGGAEGDPSSQPAEKKPTWKMTDESGAEVTGFFVKSKLEEIATSVSKEGSEGFQSVLPKEALQPGTKLDLPEQAFKQLMDMKGSQNAKFGKKELVYKGTREIAGQACGVFDVRVQVSDDSGRGPVMKMTIGGEMAISLDGGRVVLVDMAGNLGMSSSDPNAQMSGGGVITIKSTTSFSK
ncbi:MAG TPA: hypothetical protein DEA08_37975, partial [Planctomycetes bacterium]|nr:hypothetical protein [Planctomycetota bacterium]